MTEYAHPEVLVTTEWLAGHLNDPQVRILEVDYDPSAAYELGHIPGAALVDWKRDINDTVRRDILSKAQFEQLLSRVGANSRHDARPLRRFPQLVRGICLLDVPHLRSSRYPAAQRRPPQVDRRGT